MENVLTEVKGKAALVAMDRTGSITLQRLLPLSSLEQVADVLTELGGESGSDLKSVSCDRCGGHVVESAIRQMSRCTGECPASTLDVRFIWGCVTAAALWVCRRQKEKLQPATTKTRRVLECWRPRCCPLVGL